jgi:hypothetical protein
VCAFLFDICGFCPARAGRAVLCRGLHVTHTDTGSRSHLWEELCYVMRSCHATCVVYMYGDHGVFFYVAPLDCRLVRRRGSHTITVHTPHARQVKSSVPMCRSAGAASRQTGCARQRSPCPSRNAHMRSRMSSSGAGWPCVSRSKGQPLWLHCTQPVCERGEARTQRAGAAHADAQRDIPA